MNDNEAFAQKHNEIVAMLVTPVVPGDGECDERVSLLEELLELKLPDLLRNHYLRVGHRPDVNAYCDRLLPLDAVYVDQSYLVFYEANQGAHLWGMSVDDLKQSDAPMYQGLGFDDVNSASWYPEGRSLSEFLLVQLFIQCADGAMNYPDSCYDLDQIPDQVAATGNQERQSFEGKRNTEITTYFREGQLLLTAKDRDQYKVMVCGRTPEDLGEVEAAFGLTGRE